MVTEVILKNFFRENSRQFWETELWLNEIPPPKKLICLFDDGNILTNFSKGFAETFCFKEPLLIHKDFKIKNLDGTFLPLDLITLPQEPWGFAATIDLSSIEVFNKFYSSVSEMTEVRLTVEKYSTGSISVFAYGENFKIMSSEQEVSSTGCHTIEIKVDPLSGVQGLMVRNGALPPDNNTIKIVDLAFRVYPDDSRCKASLDYWVNESDSVVVTSLDYMEYALDACNRRYNVDSELSLVFVGTSGNGLRDKREDLIIQNKRVETEILDTSNLVVHIPGKTTKMVPEIKTNNRLKRSVFFNQKNIKRQVVAFKYQIFDGVLGVQRGSLVNTPFIFCQGAWSINNFVYLNVDDDFDYWVNGEAPSSLRLNLTLDYEVVGDPVNCYVSTTLWSNPSDSHSCDLVGTGQASIEFRYSKNFKLILRHGAFLKDGSNLVIRNVRLEAVGFDLKPLEGVEFDQGVKRINFDHFCSRKYAASISTPLQAYKALGQQKKFDPFIDVVNIFDLDSQLMLSKPFLPKCNVFIENYDQFRIEGIDTEILTYLVNELQPKRIFEFGTLQGERTLIFAQNCDADIVTINLPEGELNDLGERVYGLDDTLNNIGRYFINLGYENRIVQLLQNSRDLDVNEIGARSFDMVFIDGGHDKETVESDTIKAIQLAKPGAMIIWHDFHCGQIQNSNNVGVVSGVISCLNILRIDLQKLFWIRPSLLLVGVVK